MAPIVTVLILLVPVCSVFAHLSPGELVTALGLILDIIGILLLSISGIINKKPVRTWWYLWRYVDRDDPEQTEKDPPVDQISRTGGGFASSVPPSSSSSYDWQIQLVAKQTLGASTLLIGFTLQLIGTLM